MNKNNLIYLLWTATSRIERPSVIRKDPLWDTYDVNRYSFTVSNCMPKFLANTLGHMLEKRGFVPQETPYFYLEMKGKKYTVLFIVNEAIPNTLSISVR